MKDTITVIGIFMCIILFTGTPDLADGLIHYLMKD